GEMTVLISSHELSEIDGVASHVAFLDEGKLLFEESMSDLTSRFREVQVTLEHEACQPDHLPDGWLQPRTLGNVLMFADTRFAEHARGERASAVFHNVRRIDTKPMGLRSIFTTLARATRDQAA